MLSRQTLDILYKIIVRSTIDYALPVYFHSLKVTDKAKLDRVQYSAAKIVTGALHLTNSQKLNNELAWESIESRAKFLGLSMFYKIACNLTRPLIRSCLPPWSVPDKTRSGGFQLFKSCRVYYSNSFFPYFTKLWNTLDKATRNSNLTDFKLKLTEQLKPRKRKHFCYGQKYSNMLLTRIRVGRSYLNAHSFSIGRSETPACLCDQISSETSLHYIIKCPLFTELRRTMFDQIEQQFIPRFRSVPAKRQLEILTEGYEPHNPEMKRINGQILKVTQNFILKTKRFIN
jgi:hypothetical protein